MSLLRKALPFLLAVGTLGCAADEFAGPEDQGDRSDEANSETSVALSSLGAFELEDGTCRIRYAQDQLSVVNLKSGESDAAELEWSHPRATIEYLTDGSLAAALGSSTSCAGSDIESMMLETDGQSVLKNTAGCDGSIGNVRIHMQTLAAAYFPSIDCGY